MTGPALVLDLRPGVEVDTSSGTSTTVRSSWARVDLGRVGPGLRDALDLLAREGAAEATLEDLVREVDGPAALPVLAYLLEACRQHGLLRHAVHTGLGVLARATPMPGGQLVWAPVGDGARFRLSRFALLRRQGHGILLESPLTPAEVELPTSAGVALVTALARPLTATDLGATGADAGTAPPAAAAMLGLLVASGVVVPVSEFGTTAEDEDPSLQLWEFHDLLFHSRVRRGRHVRPYGTTYPGHGRVPPLPALRPDEPGETVVLHRPDLTTLARDDVPFSRVLEERRSLRAHGPEPITLVELGELLFRAARVRAVHVVDPGLATSYESSDRPYPSGGAAHDLEIYVTAHECAGLDPGLYRYQPGEHTLRQVSGRTAATTSLLEDARRAAALEKPPQVLLTIASRFARLSWKYSSIAHALTLKNVGALMQTLYLVATAMHLSPCALGAGDSDAFATAAGIDYYAESSVGEFILGSRTSP